MASNSAARDVGERACSSSWMSSLWSIAIVSSQMRTSCASAYVFAMRATCTLFSLESAWLMHRASIQTAPAPCQRKRRIALNKFRVTGV